MTLQEMIERRMAIRIEMKAIHDNAIADEDRALTDEETEKWNALRTEDEELETSIKKKKDMSERIAFLDKKKKEETESHTSPFRGHGGVSDSREHEDDSGGFKNLGEFFHCIAYRRGDERLESRVQQLKDGTSGGFSVPEQFLGDLKEVAVQEAVIRPRATVIPAGTPPDASISMPTLDQTTGANRVAGGVTVYHTGESDAMEESEGTLKQVTLQPHEITGLMYSSQKLLNNWVGASAIFQRLLRTAMDATEDTDFLTGNGSNRASGIFEANARIDHNRATGSQISFADVSAMLARMKMGGSPVWLASQTIIPQLVNIRDTGDNNLWIQNAAPGIPSTLYGYPVIFNERCPALGTRGDLGLYDLSYYLIKDGSGPSVDISTEYRFNRNEVAFRIVWNVDGDSWLSAPIPLEGATSNTVSPFIILDTP
ncbi:MAG: phage major capsid protein [Gammaproteobacteria bacterium]|nr:phage major capsid protein [Gammaproteobacteria bacterium]